STLGEQRIAPTQLAPADARRALPSFGGATFKAPFALAVTGPADAAAVANGPVESTELLPGGRRQWRFAETPPLSSYLLTFCVGTTEATDPVLTRSGVPCRVWLPRGMSREGVYSRDLHRDALDWLEPYTGVPYPYRKMDGIGLPDFSAGAMENPAAITYRLRVLAADPENASTAQLKQTFEYVAHEVTHMWWGDLVTFAWWDDIWLDDASRADVTRIADVWINEPGHPLVECRRDVDAVVLSQRRFYFDAALTSDQRWPIPMVLTVDGHERRVLFDTSELRLPIGKDSWLFPTAHGIGFYRFVLDDALFAALLPHVRSLEPEERLVLVDNQWALVRAGVCPVATYVALLRALRGESDRAVLTAVY